MTDLLVLVRLYADRRQVGSLSLVELRDGLQRIAFQCDARGRADAGRARAMGNPTNDPRRPWGDTPEGRWTDCRVQHFKAPVQPPANPGGLQSRTNGSTFVRGIGALWIPLPFDRASDAATRQLLDPSIPGHRDGLGIHAGRGDADLMATHGCVRLRDADLLRLDQLIAGRRFDVAIVAAAAEAEAGGAA